MHILKKIAVFGVLFVAGLTFVGNNLASADTIYDVEDPSSMYEDVLRSSGGGGYTHDTPTSTPSNATGTLTVITNVTNDDIGVKAASDFVNMVTGTNVAPTSTFPGSTSGTTLTISSGSYSVAQASSTGYDVTYSSDCSGTIAGGDAKTCTITNNDKSLPARACSVNGLYGMYYNLPKTLPGMEAPITGVITGTTPFQYNWYTPQFFSFASNTPIMALNQPSNFFPVNDGLVGDPFYTAIHWSGSVNFSASGTYPITLGSDDDSWLYIDGQLVASVQGIHPIMYASSSYVANAGTSTIDLYFAERHVVQSGFKFAIPGASFSPCVATSTPTTPTSTIPSADLSVTKTVDNANPREGDTVRYTITISAFGPATSTGVVATDVLPGGLTFINATSSRGIYASSTGIWAIGDIAASSTATLSIAATVNAGTAGTTITNFVIAQESASSTDQNSSNDSSTVPITVQSNPCTVNCGGGGGGGGSGNIGVTGGGGGGGVTYVYSLVINGNASETTSPRVTLGLFGTFAEEMRISNDPNLADAAWEPYATLKDWTLLPGGGEKTVYAEFRGARGVGTAQDGITLITGEVLGAETGCGIYLNDFLRIGRANNPNEVKKLQTFLNTYEAEKLPVTGFFGTLTFEAVERFQTKHWEEVLLPWVPHGFPDAHEPSGYVYKTTRHWINHIVCSSLNMPAPLLP